MALIRTISGQVWQDFSAVVSPINEVLQYAGGKLAELKAEESSDIVYIYKGETRTGTNTICEISFPGSLGIDVKLYTTASQSFSITNILGDNWSIIGVKGSISIVSKDTYNYSTGGFILTLDNDGNLAAVAASGHGATGLTNPKIVPFGDDYYTSTISYTASTSTAFGSTALSLIPVPSFDGSAKYLPAVAFAHAVQYVVDGSVALGNQLWYSIGGSWYILDEQPES